MKQKLIAPIITLIIFALYSVGIIVTFFVVDIPILLKLIIIIGPLFCLVCLIIAFIQRAKEIKGGFEDDISNY